MCIRDSYDFDLAKSGNALEIIALERKIENIPFNIDENNEVIFYGFIAVSYTHLDVYKRQF